MDILRQSFQRREFCPRAWRFARWRGRWIAECEGCAPEGIEQQLGRYADTGRDVFTALNTALWDDGAYVRIRRGVVLEQPVHVLYVTAGAGAETHDASAHADYCGAEEPGRGD